MILQSVKYGENLIESGFCAFSLLPHGCILFELYGQPLTSLESHHFQDLCEASSLAATAHGTLFVPLQRSACDWTQVSLLLLLFMAFGADAPHRPTQKVVWLIGFADGRRKVKDALYYSVFKERVEAIEKAPSLSMPKS